MTMFTIKTLTQDDLGLLMNVADDVFDNPVDETFAREFLDDPRHHIVVAISEGMIVGFASAVHYIHPDKPPELWINEVGVASPFHRLGIGKAIMKQMLQLGRELGCNNAWVLTERNNEPANRLYTSVGGKIDEEDMVMYEFVLSLADFPDN
ncbi:MAG: GNAT family N-acetyltransferase [Anaerolineales bacterium]|nr:GNAT family N-acetyltransferase [Anaerolineales bacterium]